MEHLRDVLYNIEERWRCKRLLVLGDVMLDKYIWGEVGRISPEAPVPVVRATHQSCQPGGAANVAMNLAKLGAVVSLLGFTGGDTDEALLIAGLKANEIEPQFVTCAGFPTITKTRIVGGRQQMLRLDSENLGQRSEVDHERLLAKAMKELSGSHAVVLSDYAKGALTPSLCQAIIAEARRLGIPVLVDPKTADFSRYHGATTICPNLHELATALQGDPRNLDAVLAASEQMAENLDLEYLTATLSEKGIAVVRRGYRFIAPAVARQVFDVSGAGDTVIASFTMAIIAGASPAEAAVFSNHAAGVVVGKIGTATVVPHELRKSFSLR